MMGREDDTQNLRAPTHGSAVPTRRVVEPPDIRRGGSQPATGTDARPAGGVTERPAGAVFGRTAGHVTGGLRPR